MSGITVHVHAPENEEQSSRAQPGTQQESFAAARCPRINRSKAESNGGYSNPWNKRVAHENGVLVAVDEEIAAMKNGPDGIR